MRRTLLLALSVTLVSCSSAASVEPGAVIVGDTSATQSTDPSTDPSTSPDSTVIVTTDGTRPPTAEGAMPAPTDLPSSSATAATHGTEVETWFGWERDSFELTATAPIPFNSPVLSFAPETLGGVEHTYSAVGTDQNGKPVDVSIKLRVLLTQTPATADELLDAFSEMRTNAVTVRDTPNLELADHSVGTCLPSDPSKPRGPKSSEMIAAAGRLVVWAVASFPWDVCAENVARRIVDTEMRAQLQAHPALTAK